MNNNSNTHVSKGGVGFLGLLTLIFITLKLTGYINWSWIWVLSPLWLGFIVGLVFIIILSIIVSFVRK